MAAIVALVATVIAFPLAYFLAFRAGRRAGLYLILLLVPFWTSYLLRVMAWKLMLGQEGVINSALEFLGVIDEPLDALLYNRNAVIITLIYVWIPFATLAHPRGPRTHRRSAPRRGERPVREPLAAAPAGDAAAQPCRASPPRS